jgi:hypothetical protein
MRNLPLLFIASCFATLASAAEPSESMPLIDPALLGFGKPEPAVTATFSQPLDYSDTPGSIDLFETRLRLPVFGRRLDSGWAFGASLIHEYTSADFNGTLGLGSADLHALELQLSATFLPVADSGWMGLVIASPGLATDLQGISADDFSMRVIAVAGYQFSPRITLAVSGYFEQIVGEQMAMPGIGVIWRPAPDWIVQLTPPIGAIGWRATENLTFNLAAFPSGGAWNLDQDSTAVDAVILSGFRVGLGAEYRLGQNWRINVLAGMNIGGEIEFRDDAERVLRESDLDSSAFGMIGLSRRF